MTYTHFSDLIVEMGRYLTSYPPQLRALLSVLQDKVKDVGGVYKREGADETQGDVEETQLSKEDIELLAAPVDTVEVKTFVLRKMILSYLTLLDHSETAS